MLGAVCTSVFSTPCFHNHVGVLSCVFGPQQLINNQLTVITSSPGWMCLWCPDQSSTTDTVQVIWCTPRLDDQLDVNQHRYKGYLVRAVWVQDRCVEVHEHSEVGGGSWRERILGRVGQGLPT